MKKITFLTIIVIFFLIASSSILSASYVKKDDLTYQKAKQTIYVDQNVRLTRKHLERLKQVLKQEIDKKYKDILTKITNFIDIHGEINSEEIKNILIDLGINNTEVFAGKIIGKGCCTCIGSGIPFLLDPFGGVWWLGPSFFVCWNAELYYDEDDIDFTFGVLGEHITEPHSGFVPIFIGFWRSMAFFDDVGNPGAGFSILGWSPLILIDYN